MNLKSKVSSALKWSAVGKFGGQLLTWLITLVVIRLLEPEDYGLLAIATLFTALLVSLSDGGMQAAIIRKEKLDDQYLRQIFGVSLLLYLFVALSITALSVPVSHYYSDQRLQGLMVALGLNAFIRVFNLLPTALLLREMEFKKLAFIGLASQVSNSLTTVTLAYNGFGVWSLVGGQFATTLVSIILYTVIVKTVRLPNFHFQKVWEDLKYGGKITFQRVLWWASSSFDQLMIGKLLSVQQLGFYSVGNHISSLPRDKITQTINQVVFSAVSQISDNRSLVKDHLLKALRIQSLVVVPIFIGMSAVSPEIISVVLGNKWQGALYPLMILPLCMPIRMLTPPISQSTNALGVPEAAIKAQVVSLFITCLGTLAGISIDGIRGLSIAWCIIAPLNVWVLLFFTRPVLNITLFNIVSVLIKPGLAAAIMYTAIFVLRERNVSEALCNLMGISISFSSHFALGLFCLSGASIYALTIWMSDRRGVNELFSLIRA